MTVIRDEIKRLREVNAELLAACELFLKYDRGGNKVTYHDVREAITAAIEKARTT